MIKISSESAWLKCIKCGEIYPINKIIYECKKCGSLLDVIHNIEKLKELNLKELFEKRLGTRQFPYNSGVWRYKELMSSHFYLLIGLFLTRGKHRLL